MTAFAQLDEIVGHLRAVRDAAADRLPVRRAEFDRPELRVVVFGEFNRGKSTLINALLGRVVLPAKLVPTTGITTTIRFDRTDGVTIRHTDGRDVRTPLEQLGNFSTLDATSTARADIESITVGVNAPLLADGLEIVDTPGVGEQQAQTRRALDAITRADLVLFVLDARELLGSQERDFAGDWMTKKLGKPVTPVVNFLNMVEEAEREDVRRLLRPWCARLHSVLSKPWYEVAALTALKHFVTGDARPTDDFAALVGELRGCVGAKRRAVQQAARIGQLSADLADAQEANVAALKKLTSDSERVKRDREAERAELAQLSRRFAADARMTREALALTTGQKLDEKLTNLTDTWLANESKENLEASASRWFGERLGEAARECDRAGHEATLTLAGEALSRPEAFTVAEELQLTERLAVGELAATPASDKAVAGGAIAGGILGQIFIPIPVFGAVVGAAAGAFLGNWFGSKEPDYVSAYQQKAREAWPAKATQVTNTVLAQYDARTRLMTLEIAERQRMTLPPPPSEEIARRVALQRLLAECQGNLLTEV